MTEVTLQHGDRPCDHCGRYEDGLRLSVSEAIELFGACVKSKGRPRMCTAHVIRDDESDRGDER